MASASIPLEALAPPPAYGKGIRENPAPVHNHYHIGHEAAPRPWYRRRWVFWTMIGLCAFVVIAGAIVLGVVLKKELAKKSTDAAAGRDNSTATSAATSITTSITASNTASITTSMTLTATPSNSTSRPPSSTSASKDAAATATPFSMLDTSQLASTYVRSQDTAFSRRLLVRQEDTNDLVLTEWATTADGPTHYRLKDKLGSSATEAKPGTPLGLLADETGTVHLFYLSRTNTLTYAYEPTAGRWKTGELSNELGAIRASSSSSLSAAWHNGKQADKLLVVAYDNASKKLQLAVTALPAEKNAWYTADVTSLRAVSSPGQSNLAPCYSLAPGDWYDADADGHGGNNQHLLIAIAEASGIVAAWECTLDFWPPPDVQTKCNRSSAVFQDGQGSNLLLTPPPRQFSWINLHDDGAASPKDSGFGGYDFALLSMDGTDTIHENAVGAGITRKDGPGFTASASLGALSATSEDIVFVSTGKDVLVYRKRGTRWQRDAELNATVGNLAI